MSDRVPCDEGLLRFIVDNRLSLLVCSKQDNRLLIISANPGGSGCEVTSVVVPDAMGLAASEGNVVIGAGRFLRVWRDLSEANPETSVFVPSITHRIGRCSIHDVAFHPEHHGITFINTLHSSISTLDERAAFRQVWRPNFIADEGPVDCAHLNGLAYGRSGEVVVTMLAQSGAAGGWRSEPVEAGALYDAASDRPIAEGFWLPHSPVFYGDDLWFLESGRGRLMSHSGRGHVKVVSELDGLARGLAFHRGKAFVGISRLRATSGSVFNLLKSKLGDRDRCGVELVDTADGKTIGSLELTGVSEISSLHCYPKPMVHFLEPGFQDSERTWIFSESDKEGAAL